MEGLKIRVVLLLLGILFVSLFVSTKMSAEGFEGNGGNVTDIGLAADGNGISNGNDDVVGTSNGNGDVVGTGTGAGAGAGAGAGTVAGAGNADAILTAQSVDLVVKKATDMININASSLLKSYLIPPPVFPAEGFTSVPFSMY
jgi:hypothetical protein